MDDHIHTLHGAQKPFAVAYIADEITQGWVIESRSLHFILLQLVAAIDDDLLRLGVLEHDLNELLAKGTRPAGDEYNIIFPIHFFLQLKEFVRPLFPCTAKGLREQQLDFRRVGRLIFMIAQ